MGQAHPSSAGFPIKFVRHERPAVSRWSENNAKKSGRCSIAPPRLRFSRPVLHNDIMHGTNVVARTVVIDAAFGWRLRRECVPLPFTEDE